MIFNEKKVYYKKKEYWEIIAEEIRKVDDKDEKLKELEARKRADSRFKGV